MRRPIIAALCALLSIFSSARLSADEKYHGALISLDIQDGDIRSVLRILSEASGRNIVAHREVQGRLDLRLKDVPWDQALDAVIKLNSLYKIEKGKVIILIPLEKVRETLETEQ